MRLGELGLTVALPSWLLGFDPLTLFLVGWWTVVGAMIGSFVNVVVWRLPRGESLSDRGSHCPRCGHAIRFYDNIPVVSYVLLGGHCRDCRAPISARYPTVEALFALLFFVLATIEGAGDLANLPGAGKPVFSPATLWGAVTLHLALLSTLLTALLIERDGWSVPFRLFIPVAMLAVVLPLFIRGIQPLPLLANDAGWPNWQTALATSTAGGLLAAIPALVAHQLAPRHVCRGFVGAAVAVGLAVGWQLATWLVTAGLVLTVLLQWQTLLRPHRLLGLFFWLVVGGLIGWKTLATHCSWLGAEAPVASWPAALLPAILAGLVLRRYPQSEISPRHFPLQSKPATKDSSTMNRPTPAVEAILNSPTYRLPELDTDFLQRPELRPVRVQLELLKPEMILEEEHIHSTVVVFGGTQIVERSEAEERLAAAQAALAESPDDRVKQRGVSRAERILAKSFYYDDAREFARSVSEACQCNGQCDFVIVTGGGPGIMEAANRGAHDAGSKSMGLNITLPQEQLPNPYITPELCFQFHYFAMRKMHFLLRARALVVFPGGFGTLDELFDALTLRQTERMQDIPIVLYGTEYWRAIIDFQRLADEGVIRDEHLELIHFADSPKQAWEIIARYHGVDPVTGTLCHNAEPRAGADSCPDPASGTATPSD